MGLGQAVADHATWWAKQVKDSDLADGAERAAILTGIAQAAPKAPQAGDPTVRWSEDVAVVTGVAPGSIAAAVVGELLAGGATVVATSSRLTHERLEFATTLYREHAAAGAKLWMVPANLSSYRDVDALAEWIGNDQVVTSGGSTKVVKEALVPTLLFPFAAPRVSGTLADAGPAAESQTRLLLWSVERTIAALSAIGTDTHVDHRLHVVLPGSRTEAPSVVTAPTGEVSPPWTPSPTAGPPNGSGPSASPWPTRASAGSGGPASWVATTRSLPPSRPPGSAPGPPRRSPPS